MNKRHTLSISMIVKNEERHLGRLLASVVTFADEIVVLDTGSTDDTRAIAAAHNARVYEFKWCDDFAAARNESLQYCQMDFVMWLDADDLIEPDSAERLRELFSAPVDWDVLYLPYQLLHSTYSPKDKYKGKRKMPPRIWRNRIGIRWASPIHEYLVYPRGVVKKRDMTGIEVLHHPLEDSGIKSDRNLRIMKNVLRDPKHSNDDYILWHIAKEYSQLGNWRQAAGYFEKAIHYCDRSKRFLFARLYLGLARQYRAGGDYSAALLAAATCAISYGDWREPYCEMAENLFRLGDVRTGEAYLALSSQIEMHSRQVERVELYDSHEFAKFRERLQTYATEALRDNFSENTNKVTRLAAGGDVCLGRQLPGWVEKHGTGWCFRGLREQMLAADLMLVNLEAVTSTLGDFADKGGRRPYFYHNRPEMLDILVEAGVSVVNVANNHAGDYGPEAFEQQLEILDACGLAQCGGGRDYIEAAQPTYIMANNRVIAFIGIESETPSMAADSHRSGIAFTTEDKLPRILAASIAIARCYADVVIVTPHWGHNWVENPPEARRKLAHHIIDLGADVILGHSAHILQGMEVYRGRPIIYDMGTLLFDRVAENRIRYSALFELDLNDRGAQSLRITPLQLLRGRARLAHEDVCEYVRNLLVRLSEALDSGIVFRRNGESLELNLVPDQVHVALPRLSLQGKHCYRPKEVQPVPRYYRQLPSNVVYPEIPVKAAFKRPVKVNPWLEVCGSRHASVVRPGCGFLCEVFFRAEPPAAGRWEAQLAGLSQNGDKVFEYTHPIAEGIWPQSRWCGKELIGDRVIVRPSAGLTEGRYRLLWRLVDRDGGEVMSSDSCDEGLEAGMVAVGEIQVSFSAPQGVAWLDKDMK